MFGEAVGPVGGGGSTWQKWFPREGFQGYSLFGSCYVLSSLAFRDMSSYDHMLLPSDLSLQNELEPSETRGQVKAVLVRGRLSNTQIKNTPLSQGRVEVIFAWVELLNSLFN